MMPLAHTLPGQIQVEREKIGGGGGGERSKRKASRERKIRRAKEFSNPLYSQETHSRDNQSFREEDKEGMTQ